MTDNNVKMLLRYGYVILVTTAVNRGWIAEEIKEPIVLFLVELSLQASAAIPIIWAWLKVDNTPKKDKS